MSEQRDNEAVFEFESFDDLVAQRCTTDGADRAAAIIAKGRAVRDALSPFVWALFFYLVYLLMK